MTAPVPATPETPADTLRRAARAVRETAAPANDEDWRVAVDTEGQVVMGCGGIDVAQCRDPFDASWIALVGRQVADPLAAWLDDAADRADRLDALLEGPFADLADARRRGQVREPDVDLPLALARVLLGGEVS